MNKVLAILKIENIFISLKNIFSRFFLPSFLSIFVTIIFIFLLQNNFIENLKISSYTLGRINFSLILTFFFSVGFYIFCESLNFSNKKKQLFQIIPIIYSFLFFYFFNPELYLEKSILFLFINLILIFSFLFFAPYLKNIFNKNLKNIKQNQENFYCYFTAILWAFIASYLIGATIFILINIGFFSLEHLFDLNINGNKYFYLFIVCSCLISPFFGLHILPKKETFENGKFNESNFGLFLIKYISIPAIFIYFIILYAYSIKVLINFSDWPKGEVSLLVMGFSIFGYIIYICSYIYEEKISSVKKFRKYFPSIILPQIFMLFYAIFLRINQYGLTLNRYLVVIFGILLLVLSFYYIFSKRKLLSFIFFAIFIFSIIISIGPWSVYNFTDNNKIKIENKKI